MRDNTITYSIGAVAVGGLIWWAFVPSNHMLSPNLDRYIMSIVISLSTQNEIINKMLFRTSELGILTGGLLTCMVWYLWFDDNSSNARARLLTKIAAVLVSAVIGPSLQWWLPRRLRPLHDPASGFVPLPGIDPTLLSNWGSFPSDHAVVFFAFVTLIWQRSQRLGMLALVSALYACLMRIYVGAHYPSDVVGGGSLGIAFVLLSDRFVAPARFGIACEKRWPALFYGAAFLISFELATLFDDIRRLARSLPALLQQLGVNLPFS